MQTEPEYIWVIPTLEHNLNLAPQSQFLVTILISGLPCCPLLSLAPSILLMCRGCGSEGRDQAPLNSHKHMCKVQVMAEDHVVMLEDIKP